MPESAKNTARICTKRELVTCIMIFIYFGRQRLVRFKKWCIQAMRASEVSQTRILLYSRKCFEVVSSKVVSGPSRSLFRDFRSMWDEWVSRADKVRKGEVSEIPPACCLNNLTQLGPPAISFFSENRPKVWVRSLCGV